MASGHRKGLNDETGTNEKRDEEHRLRHGYEVQSDGHALPDAHRHDLPHGRGVSGPEQPLCIHPAGFEHDGAGRGQRHGIQYVPSRGGG